ncbi:hypothetical protein PFISCL1PPCAC_3485, partial [Pristionchus fissidentatus]
TWGSMRTAPALSHPISLPRSFVSGFSRHFKMVIDVSSPKTCLICAAPMTVPHYGIESCRACASFFKRAKLSDKKFACRQGGNNCSILKGMVYDNKHTATELSSTHTAQRSLSDPEEFRPSSSREPVQSILKQIGRQFNASVDSRRTQELQLLQSRSDLKFAPHPTQKLYWVNYETSVPLFHISMNETRIFYEKAFPAIAKLSVEEQDLLAKSYFPKFAIVDNMHRTRKVWGDMKRFIMASVVSTIDLTRLDLCFGEE